jgi:guanylate kinase
MSSKRQPAPGMPHGAPRSLLLVLSGPSGGGKTTLCRHLLAEDPRFAYSVSCTTRAPRGEERDGRDYHFVSAGEFERRLRAGDFLEHATVHGQSYGTLRQTVLAALEGGRDVVLAIDVQGAAQIRARAAQSETDHRLQQAFVDVFVTPPSLEVLRDRLQRRGVDAPDVIEQRLRNAVAELSRWQEYRYLIINDRLDEACAQLKAIVTAERCRSAGSRGP